MCVSVCVCTCTYRWAASTLCSSLVLRQDETRQNRTQLVCAPKCCVASSSSATVAVAAATAASASSSFFASVSFPFLLVFYICHTHTHAHKLAHTCNVAHKAWLLNGQLDKGGAGVGAWQLLWLQGCCHRQKLQTLNCKYTHRQTPTHTHTLHTQTHTCPTVNGTCGMCFCLC